MQLFFAVAQDLFSFAMQALFGAHAGRQAEPQVIYLTKPHREVVVQPPRPLAPLVMGEPRVSAPEKQPLSPRKNTVMYIASIDVPLRSAPVTSADNVLDTLGYGTMLMVLDMEDGWSKVIAGVKEGWVLNDDLADRAAYVYPQFSLGDSNDADDPNTIRLRAMIRDAFFAGSAGLPLQSEEFALYKLYRRGVRVDMPQAMSYEPGRWSLILRELPNAAISQEPKAGAVMQLHMPEDATMEHFAYVEAVFPDGSLQISEANWPQDGIYNERVLVKEEWHTFNPVFFVVT